MGDHAGEEDGVEPGEGGAEAGDQAPGQREEEVARVVDLAGVCVWFLGVRVS